MKYFTTILFVLCLALAGCVNTKIENKDYSPVLMMSQNSDGEVQLAWESDSSYLYTIYYRDGDSPWREMNSANKVRGTGEAMTTTDRVDPSKPMRRYRLHFEK